MSRIAIIAGGYIGAFLAALGLTAIYIALADTPDRQASGGMSAFGDSVLFMGLLGFFALAPTGALLYFLRPVAAFWRALSGIALLISSTAVIAAIVYMAQRGAAVDSALVSTWAGVAVLRLFVAPVLSGIFFVAALFAPRKNVRIALLCAAAMEGGAFVTGMLALMTSR